MVVSDHPHVSSLQLSLATVWTEAKARGYSLNQLIEWMCRATARLAGLERKGAIDVGFDADLTICNPDDAAEALVERTYLRGTRVYERGAPMAAPNGRVL
jgi:allantoinase